MYSCSSGIVFLRLLLGVLGLRWPSRFNCFRSALGKIFCLPITEAERFSALRAMFDKAESG